MLRLIRQHPITGLLLALSVEAWLPLPGELMIAVAASALISKTGSFLRSLGAGVAGIMINNLALFGLSRLGRDVLVDHIGLHLFRFHLSAQLLAGAQFLPPLRSAAYVVYGLQGASFTRFLWVSLLSSLLWVALYCTLGEKCSGLITRFLRGAERHRGWMTFAETVLTLAVVASFLH